MDTLVASFVLISEMLKYGEVEFVFKIKEVLWGAGAGSKDTGRRVWAPCLCTLQAAGSCQPWDGSDAQSLALTACTHRTNSQFRCCCKVLEKDALNTLLTFM